MFHNCFIALSLTRLLDIPAVISCPKQCVNIQKEIREKPIDIVAFFKTSTIENDYKIKGTILAIFGVFLSKISSHNQAYSHKES